MSMRETIEQKLRTRFTPDHLEIIDESHLHHNHAGWREGGETHFRVRIATHHFDRQSRLTQHRFVMDALGEELKGGVHALTIEVLPVGGPYARPSRV